MSGTGVAVVGSINADLTVFGSPLPRPGETVSVERFALGGAEVERDRKEKPL